MLAISFLVFGLPPAPEDFSFFFASDDPCDHVFAVFGELFVEDVKVAVNMYRRLSFLIRDRLVIAFDRPPLMQRLKMCMVSTRHIPINFIRSPGRSMLINENRLCKT